jgi:hypothetical protein
MKMFGKKLEEKLHLDHGLCINRVFKLTANLAFKSTKGQKRKSAAITNGDSPMNDEIDTLRKARNFTTVLTHSTQLVDTLN